MLHEHWDVNMTGTSLTSENEHISLTREQSSHRTEAHEDAQNDK